MPKTWKVINDDKKNKDEGDNNKDDNNKDDRDNKVENDKTNFPPYSAAWRASSGSARGRAAVCRSPEISICSRRRRPGILRIYHICYIYWGCIIHLQKTNDLGIYHSSGGKSPHPISAVAIGLLVSSLVAGVHRAAHHTTRVQLHASLD